VELLVPLRQPEEDFVGLALVLEIRRFKRLDEVDVEVAWRLSRGPFVGGAEEEITAAARLALAARELVLPDAVAGDVGRRLRVLEHDAAQTIEVVAIELGVAQRLRPLFDERVEVDILLEVEVVLAVLTVEREKLTADGLHDLAEHGLDGGLEEL